MEVKESIVFFNDLCDNYTITEVETLRSICLKLKMNQNTLSNVIYAFYYCRNFLRIEPDDVVFYTSIIDLSYKISETSKSLEAILKTCSTHLLVVIDENTLLNHLTVVNQTQLRILRSNSCDLNELNLYDKMNEICKKHALDVPLVDMCWTLINDLATYYPSTLFFTENEVIYAAFYFLCLYHNEKIFKNVSDRSFSKSHETNFIRKFDIEEDITAIRFLTNNLVTLYESCNKQHRQ